MHPKLNQESRAFIKATKKILAFVIYTTPLSTSTKDVDIEFHIEYHEFKDAFKKKNVDILPQH